MTACKTDIDWSRKPEPWSRLGPQFRMECETIAKDCIAPPPTKPFVFTQKREEGALLRSRRHALGLTQIEVGRKAGYGDTWVSDVENGKGSSEAADTIGEALTQLEAARK